MKIFSISLAAISLVSTGLLAQAAADETASTATAVTGLEFNGAVETGMRSELSGAVKGGGENNIVGPYAKPNLSLGYSNPTVSINTGYEFEAFGGKGFGEGFEGSRDFQDNTYFSHLPSLSITGKLDSNWTMAAYTEYLYKIYSGNDANNLSELIIEPSLTRKLGNRFSVGVAYQYYRGEGFDAAGTDLGDLDVRSGTRAAINQAISEALIDPTTQRHVAKLIGSATITEASSVKAYVHAGRQYKNHGGADANVYRFNGDLSTTAVQNLDLGIRYRFNMEDRDGTTPSQWYHLGGIYATYSVTDALAVTLSNEAQLKQTTDTASTYANENYLGLSYSF